MKAYLDTNVLVPASVQAHHHHAQAFDVVKAVKDGDLNVGAHGLAEFYSVLTRTPFTPRVHPTEASRFLDDNVLPSSKSSRFR